MAKTKESVAIDHEGSGDDRVSLLKVCCFLMFALPCSIGCLTTFILIFANLFGKEDKTVFSQIRLENLSNFTLEGTQFDFLGSHCIDTTNKPINCLEVVEPRVIQAHTFPLIFSYETNSTTSSNSRSEEHHSEARENADVVDAEISGVPERSSFLSIALQCVYGVANAIAISLENYLVNSIKLLVSSGLEEP